MPYRLCIVLLLCGRFMCYGMGVVCAVQFCFSVWVLCGRYRCLLYGCCLGGFVFFYCMGVDRAAYCFNCMDVACAASFVYCMDVGCAV